MIFRKSYSAMINFLVDFVVHERTAAVKYLYIYIAQSLVAKWCMPGVFWTSSDCLHVGAIKHRKLRDFVEKHSWTSATTLKKQDLYIWNSYFVSILNLFGICYGADNWIYFFSKWGGLKRATKNIFFCVFYHIGL